jgi:protein transport protein SEC20
MAPIPVTFDDSTNNTIDNLNRRLKDLSELQIPRLRKCTGPLTVQQRLSAELRDDLDACVQHFNVGKCSPYE